MLGKCQAHGVVFGIHSIHMTKSIYPFVLWNYVMKWQ